MLNDPYNLQRFVTAQDPVFEKVLSELRAGAKSSHWMWFVFPQLAGLGHSHMARYFALASAAEARAFFDHPQLGGRLCRCVETLLSWSGIRTAEEILGATDAVKLKSSLTLFDVVRPEHLFSKALEAFFDRQRDQRTLALLQPEA